MSFFAPACSLLLWIIPLPGEDKKINETDLFSEIVSSAGVDLKESLGLRSKLKSNPIESKSSHAGMKDYLFIYTRRMPAAFGKKQKANIVSMQAANGILGLAATQSQKVLQKLDSFKQPKILIEYAGERLFSKVAGRITGLTERKRFFEKDKHFGIFIRLPREQVDLSAIEIISHAETKSFYSIAVGSLAHKSMIDGKFENAMPLLLESLKYGNNTKGLFVSLYKCFVRTGNRAESEKLSAYLNKRFGSQIGFDETLELATLADSAEFKKQSDFWYAKAESFFGLPPSPDKFSPAP